MRRRQRSEEGPQHERWLVSYADFMTLLFALFVVLFASSHHDQVTARKLSSAIKDGFQELGTFSERNTALEVPSSDFPKVGSLPFPLEIGETNSSAIAPNSNINLLELQQKLRGALGKEIERQEVVMRLTPEGFVISLRELGFFDSGESRLLPGAAEKIKRIAGVLMQYGLDLRVEGHSDNVPIHNAVFGSNWDLSTARAMAVAMMLLNDSGFDPQRISIAGYGQYHPVASNATQDGRKVNRRVDLVVVAAAKPAPTKVP